MKEYKILLVFEDGGEYKVESLWAEKLDANYKILNTPFFAKNVAYGDVVSVEVDNGELYFDSLVEESGHSTIQIIILNQDDFEPITQTLIQMKCDWEGSHIKELITVNIPKEISYSIVKTYLDNGEANKVFSYREACISSYHRATKI